MEAEAMRAFHDRPSSFPVFDCFLAEQLGRLPHEVRDMPHADYVNLAAYYKVKGVLRRLQADHAAKQR